uniref:Uncharacterized protein n=1 Tax=Panagrolaimus davidi TaxID=227884 RepID=A0A914P8E9_9BILA
MNDLKILIKAMGFNGGFSPPLTRRYFTKVFINMPELNPDIFQEIVQNIIEKRSLENLTKLMIAGRETFHGVLAHFSKAKCVHVTSSSIEVYWTNYISYWGGYQIAFDFPFLKSIIKALAQNVIKVKIGYCRDNPIFDFVVSHFITKNLKSVDLSDTLSEHQNCFLEELLSETLLGHPNCILEELSLSYLSLVVKNNLSILPETCKILNVSYIDFVDIFKYKLNRITFQFVESLTISKGEFKVKKLDTKSIKKLLKIITKSFPSLKEFNATFEDEEKSDDFDGMTKKMQNLQSNRVCKLKGNLSHLDQLTRLTRLAENL